MPNPLINARPFNTGKRADDRPHAIDPRPETYVGENNAYRGTESHGVEVDSRPEEIPGYDDMHSGEFIPEKEEPEPIPVIVMKGYRKELRRFVTYQDIIQPNGVVRQIAGRNMARTTIRIRNFGTQRVFIGNTESVNAVIGYPLDSGATLDLDTDDAVFAMTSDVASQAVAMLESFVVRE